MKPNLESKAVDLGQEPAKNLPLKFPSPAPHMNGD